MANLDIEFRDSDSARSSIMLTKLKIKIRTKTSNIPQSSHLRVCLRVLGLVGPPLLQQSYSYSKDVWTIAVIIYSSY